MSAESFADSLQRRVEATVAHLAAFATGWCEALATAGEPPRPGPSRSAYAEKLCAAFRGADGLASIGFPHALVMEPMTTALGQRALAPLLAGLHVLTDARSPGPAAQEHLRAMAASVENLDFAATGQKLAYAQTSILRALLEFRSATDHCEQLSSRATESALALFCRRSLELAATPEWEPGDLEERYRDWLESLACSYAKLLRDDDYLLAFGARLNAAADLAQAIHEWTATFPLVNLTPGKRASPWLHTTASPRPGACRPQPATPSRGDALVQAKHQLETLEQQAEQRLSALRQRGRAGNGSWAREVVWQQQGIQLYHYRPKGPVKSHVAPLLVVYAMVNRPGMLDLHEGRSLLRGLLQHGVEVYLLDWGDPGAARQWVSLDDHITAYLDQCVAFVLNRTRQRRLNLLGVCQGGILALCYTALNPQRVARLVTMVTPVDFHCRENDLAQLARHVDFDRLVAASGNVPGGLLNALFLSLSPVRQGLHKYLDLIQARTDPEHLEDFLRMESWIYDSPDQPGHAFAQFGRQFIQGNALVRGLAHIAGQRLDLGRIRCPVLNVYATEDHLVPPASARALRRLLPAARYREYAFRGGHIGIYVSRRAQGRVAGVLATWLAEP